MGGGEQKPPLPLWAAESGNQGEAMARLSVSRVRKIRRELKFTRKEFARALWVASKTVNEWESGSRTPVGAHHRLLLLLEHGLSNASFKSALRDPRAGDPLFLLYRLLELLYGSS
jgi:DNA-binding transcriptional regulator YiaG